MVAYTKHDLQFILDGIVVSETHADLTNDTSSGSWVQTDIEGSRQILLDLLPNSFEPIGMRTISGELNNLVHGQSNFGATGEFPRLLDPDYRDDATTGNSESPFPLGPGGVPSVTNTDYSQSTGSPSGGNVVDSDPRIISNLIVDQSVNNPAAVNRAGADPGLDGIWGTADDILDDGVAILDPNGIAGDGDEQFFFENVAPDEGLSAPFNSWMTLFGQFFDHGLDLVNKGSSGTIFIPLQPDDPLFDADGADDIPNSGDELNFMVLTRATVDAGPDGILGTADDIADAFNVTSPFVDQNQTYTSHPSHQIFVREYVPEGGVAGNPPVATGALIEGAGGGMANWGEVKDQAATLLGIELTDVEAINIPLFAVDQYGEFIPGASGLPQFVMSDGSLVEGDLTNPVSVADAEAATGLTVQRTGFSFLVDIANAANPVDGQTQLFLQRFEDGDAANGGAPDGSYDGDLLDAHFIAGDGRANENFGLTAVHHVFHQEHNRLVEHTKAALVVADGNGDIPDALGLLEGFLTEPLPANFEFVDRANFASDAAFEAAVQAQVDALSWDGDRLFQAAKFGTEMQYQHLVFEEFGRKVQPLIDIFASFEGTVDAAIVAEFAHTVYRFGHSMLTESVDLMDADGNLTEAGLIEAFLNPIGFHQQVQADGLLPAGADPLDSAAAAGAIVRGMTRQAGNEIDEFVTGALRNNLLGLPLDLAAINIARGRETGIPTLNDARAQFFAGTSDTKLKPYESWFEFALNLKNEMSIINFIAAYGQHDAITLATTLQDKRDAAVALALGDGDDSDGVTIGGVVYTDRVDFLNSTGTWANQESGLNLVDFWIGGLAEAIEPFGGMLGSTFNFVFEDQMERLQDGDRFYYLGRTAGLNFVTQLEQNSFANMIIRNTDIGDNGFDHLPGDIFSTPAFIFEVDQSRQITNLDADGVTELAGGNGDPAGESILIPAVIRDNPNTVGPDTNYLHYTGGEHVVLGGDDNDNILIGGIGDDTLWGEGGNDRLEGGDGADIILGGDGDDIITDIGGPNNLQGQGGNDAIFAGGGESLILAGEGKDFVLQGPDFAETFGGQGDDFIHAGSESNIVFGNEGNDWLEGGGGNNLLQGDNGDPFLNSTVTGHDVFIPGLGDDDYDAESGDDIMLGGIGVQRFEGLNGFDWASYADDTDGIEADFFLRAFDETPIPPSPEAIMDRFDSVEGLSGSAFSDILRGGDADEAVLRALNNGGDHVLRNFDLIDGLRAEQNSGDATDNSDVLFNEDVTEWAEGDIILGGAGSDLIEGRGGNDLIDGDLSLNVRLAIYAPGTGPGNGQPIATADRMHGPLTTDGTTPVDPADFGGASTLNEAVFNGSINPGDIHIVREILNESAAGDFDTAVFSGNLADYDIEGSGTANGFADIDGDGFITVSHDGGAGAGLGADGVDQLRNIERLQFSDAELSIPGLNSAPTGAPVIVEPGTTNPVTAPTVGQQISVDISGIMDADGVPALITGFSFTWKFEEDPGSGIFIDFELLNAAGEDTGLHGQTITVPEDAAGSALRVEVSYQDGNGVIERVVSAPTGSVGGTVATEATGGDDLLLGTNFDDNGVAQPILEGLGGDDDIQALAGDDILVGGSFAAQDNAGNDILDGGPGQDRAIFFGDPLDITVFEFAIAPDETDPTINRLEVVDVVAGTEDLLIDVEILEFRLPDGSVLNLSAANLISQLEVDTTAEPSLAIINVATSGADFLVGTPLNDTLDGLDGDDTVLGLAGDDTLNGGPGSDIVNGGEGDDVLQLFDSAPGELDELIGGPDTDTADFSGFGSAVWVGLDFNGIEAWTNDDVAFNSGMPFRTISDLEGIENLIGTDFDDRLGGDLNDNRFIYTEGLDTVFGRDGSDTIDFSNFDSAVWLNLNFFVDAWTQDDVDLVGGTWREIGRLSEVENAVGTDHHDELTGSAAANTFEGGQGDDDISTLEGDDTIIWNAGDGHDVVDGGTNDAAGDTMQVNGSAASETFRVYAVADPTVMLPAGLAALRDPTSEIVITYDDGSGEQIVSELKNVEELVINTQALANPPAADPTGDTIEIIGDFSTTSLNLNTITINGGSKDDTVDISQLTSDHRVVFNTNGGTDTIIGSLRSQDEVNTLPGASVTDNGDGTTTISGGMLPTGPVLNVTSGDISALIDIVNGRLNPRLGEDHATGVRDLEGTGNNIVNPNFGSADQPFIRLTDAHYGTEIEQNGVVVNRALNPIFDGLDPRTISNIISDQSDAPAPLSEGVNVMFNAFAQYFDHGLDFVPKGDNGTGDAETISIGGPGVSFNPADDNPLDLDRATVNGFDSEGVPQHLNKTSPFVDQNQTYGSTELVGQFLRESDGNGGFGARLLAGQPDPSNTAFNLLPTLGELILHHWHAGSEFSDPAKFSGTMTLQDAYAGLVDANDNIDATILAQLNVDFMGSGHALLLDTNPGIPLAEHFVVGDGRANENITLTSVHTIWAREHNRLVQELTDSGFFDAGGTAAELFEAAKIINVAQYQRVVYDEFADALLGGMRGSGSHGFDGYNSSVDASISHEFAGAAYRFGHSLLSETVTVLDENGNPEEIGLINAFLNPSNADGPGYAEIGVTRILGGIIGQPAEVVDANIVDAVRDNLVRQPADLAALNIARGRDLGLGTLNQVKRDLNDSSDPYVREAIELGVAGEALQAYTSWEDFQDRNDLSDALIDQFKLAYPDLDLDTLSVEDRAAFLSANPDVPLVDGHIVAGIDRVDFWLGGLTEMAVNDGLVGETFWVILHEQLDRLQEGDRFYYIDRVDDFDFYQAVEDQTFADIIARNTGLSDLPEEAFIVDNDDIEADDDDTDDDGENLAPVVGAPVRLGELENTMTMSVSFVIVLSQLLSGASDPDGDSSALTVENLQLAAGSRGMLVDNGDGTWTYTTEAGDTSSAYFSYFVSDGSDTTVQSASLDLLAESGAVIEGTADANNLIGTNSDDLISGHGAADLIAALAGDDVIDGGDGADNIIGGDGADLIFGGEGDDRIFGNEGDDHIFGDEGDDRIWGDEGDDVLEGGIGSDTVDGGADNDTVLATFGDGDDIYFGGTGSDTYDLSATTANATVDLSAGTATSAQTGSDALAGFENVVGSFGDDQITANTSANVLTGGLGDDTFIFGSAAAADGDQITDFQPGDRIDLSMIDANTLTSGDQAFQLISEPTFTNAGQIMFSFTNEDGTDLTLVQGNISGGTDADFTVQVTGHVTLTVDDFLGVQTV